MGIGLLKKLSILPQAANSQLTATSLIPVAMAGGDEALPISELDKRYVQQPTGGSGASRIVTGVHVPTSGEVSADTLTIATGLTTIASIMVQVVTTSTGKVATSDAALSFSAGNLTIANGSSFTLATTQTISWFASGV